MDSTYNNQKVAVNEFVKRQTEGSGKSYLSKKLYKVLRRKRASVVLTREPGGTKRAEKIRHTRCDPGGI